jgi:Holliday junction resolvase RusA-like endonuclease
MKYSFFVPGIPAPGGSKRFVGFGKKTGRAILIDSAGEKNKNWRSIVGTVGSQYCKEMLSGPLRVRFVFKMPRPKYHFDSNGNLKLRSPAYHTTKPDALKLARSTEDALTGIAWHDDSQTSELEIIKEYTGTKAGCHITIETIDA